MADITSHYTKSAMKGLLHYQCQGYLSKILELQQKHTVQAKLLKIEHWPHAVAMVAYGYTARAVHYYF